MISTKERSILKSKCNTLKATVNVGKGGLTENVLKEIQTTLFHNEIVKVAVLKSCLDSPVEMMKQVCASLEAEEVWNLGYKFVVYKRSDKEKIEHLLK